MHLLLSYRTNYHHFGEPKDWDVIPPRFGRRFEEEIRGLANIVYDPSLQICSDDLAHKRTMTNSSILEKKQKAVIKV
jgi:hypothetical protein